MSNGWTDHCYPTTDWADDAGGEGSSGGGFTGGDGSGGGDGSNGGMTQVKLAVLMAATGALSAVLVALALVAWWRP